MLIAGKADKEVQDWCGENLVRRRLSDQPRICAWACCISLWLSPRLGGMDNPHTAEFDLETTVNAVKSIRTGLCGMASDELMTNVAFAALGVPPSVQLMHSIHGICEMLVPGYEESLRAIDSMPLLRMNRASTLCFRFKVHTPLRICSP